MNAAKRSIALTVMNSAIKVRASSIERIGIRKKDQRKFINSRSAYHLRIFFYDMGDAVSG
jgi:hypothetical protein